jgi:hypothetical protein
MTERDYQLLDRIRELNRYLNYGATVRMVQAKLRAQFIDDIRDLGDWLWELGSELLEHADELDNN